MVKQSSHIEMASARLDALLTQNDARNGQHQPAPLTNNNNMVDTQEIEFARTLYKEQNFWKYHILKTNLYQFYLTTNPDERHKFIRSGPAYDVTYTSTGKSQYTLTFVRQSYNIETNNESFVITRDVSGSFHISGVVSQYLSTSSRTTKIFNSIPQTSTNSIGPPCQRNSPANDKWMRSSEISFDEQYRFSVNHPTLGLIKLGSLLNKENRFSKMLNSGSNSNVVVPLGDSSVYLFKDSRQKVPSLWYDGLTSIFRPCKRNVMNKISYNMKHAKISNSRFSSATGITQEAYDDDEDEDDEGDFDEDEESSHRDSSDVSSKRRSLSMPMSSSDSNTLSNNYYRAKDGLFHKHSKDDSPSDYKLGWITIYDNNNEDYAHPNGNWETVLGLTFALGFERNLQEYLAKEKKQLM